MVSKALSIAKTGVVINSSINFCLYCLSGKKFRKELRILTWYCCYDDYEMTGSSMTSSSSSSTAVTRTKSAMSAVLDNKV